MAQLNTWSDISAIANAVQEDAYLVVRETAIMKNFVTVFSDLSGGNLRKSYKHGSVTAVAINEADELNSSAFTPSADQTLTPAEIGAQFFISDLRRDSEAPENILTDAARELGLAGADKINNDIAGDMASLTGGAIGTSGSAITWGYVAAAIAQARNANKSIAVPLNCVIHGYQAAVLAKSASIAGATVASSVVDGVTKTGLTQAFTFLGVPIYQVFVSPDSNSDFTGGVFPKQALAFDVRRDIRIEPERKPAKRGLALNMSAVYAHGVWRPALGVKMIFAATAPTS